MSVNIRITVDGSGAESGVRQVNRALSTTQRQSQATHSQVGRLERGLGGLRTAAIGVGSAFAAYFTVRTVTDFTRTAISEFSELERVQFRLQRQVELTGHAWADWEYVNDVARQLGRDTLTSAEQARQAASLVLTSQEITQEGFERTLNISQDLAETYGLVLPTATRYMTRAMSDASGTLSMFRRYGLELSESQQEVIKSLQEAGRESEAYDYLLSALEARIGGTAIEAAQGLAGSLDTLGEVKRELREEIGSHLSPIIDEVVGRYTDWLDVNREMIGQNMPDYMDQLVRSITFVIDAGAGVKRVFEGAGSATAVVVLGMERSFWQLADTIWNGPINMINNLIELYNRVPALPEIEVFDLTRTGQAVEDKIEFLERAIQAGREDIADILSKPLPGSVLYDHFQEARQAAESTFDTVEERMDRLGSRLPGSLGDLEGQFGDTAESGEDLADVIEDIERKIFDLTSSEYERRARDLEEQIEGWRDRAGETSEELDGLIEKWRELMQEAMVKDALSEALSFQEDFEQEVDESTEYARYAFDRMATEKERIWGNMMDGIQQSNYSATRRMLDGNLTSWRDHADDIVSVMKDAAAQIFAAFTQRQIVLPIMLAMPGVGPMDMQSMGQMGGAGNVSMPSGGAMSWVQNNVPGMGWLGSSLPGTGPIGMPAAYASHPAYAAGPGQYMAAPTWGTALGAGAISGLGYQFVGPHLGLPTNQYTGLTSGVGGALGYWGGSALASGAMAGASFGSAVPIIGTVLGALGGGLLGGLFGSSGSSKPPRHITSTAWHGFEEDPEYGVRKSRGETIATIGDAEQLAQPVQRTVDLVEYWIDEIGGSLEDFSVWMETSFREGDHGLRVKVAINEAVERWQNRAAKGFEDINWDEISGHVFEGLMREADWSDTELEGIIENVDFSSLESAIADLRYVLGFEDKLIALASGIEEVRQQIDQAVKEEFATLSSSLEEQMETAERLGLDLEDLADAQLEYVKSLVLGRESMGEAEAQMYALEQRYRAYYDLMVEMGMDAEEAARVAREGWERAKEEIEQSFDAWQGQLQGISEAEQALERYGLTMADAHKIIVTAANMTYEEFIAAAGAMGMTVEELKGFVDVINQEVVRQNQLIHDSGRRLAESLGMLGEAIMGDLYEKSQDFLNQLNPASIDEVTEAYRGLNELLREGKITAEQYSYIIGEIDSKIRDASNEYDSIDFNRGVSAMRSMVDYVIMGSRELTASVSDLLAEMNSRTRELTEMDKLRLEEMQSFFRSHQIIIPGYYQTGGDHRVGSYRVGDSRPSEDGWGVSTVPVRHFRWQLEHLASNDAMREAMWDQMSRNRYARQHYGGIGEEKFEQLFASTRSNLNRYLQDHVGASLAEMREMFSAFDEVEGLSDVLTGGVLDTDALEEWFDTIRQFSEDQLIGLYGEDVANQIRTLMRYHDQLLGADPMELERQTRLERTRLEMQKKIAELEGDEARQAELLVKIRQLELEAMDESLRPLQQRIWELEDEAQALADVSRWTEQFTRAAERLRDARLDLFTGSATPFDIKTLYEAQAGQLDDLLRQAHHGGVEDSLEAMERLPGAITDYLGTAKQIHTDPLAYSREVAKASHALGATESAARQRSDAELLRKEVEELRLEVRRMNENVSENTGETAHYLGRWESGGLPEFREGTVGVE